MEPCKNLLIAECGRSLQTALHPYLKEKGYKVKVVNSFKDVLTTLQEEKIHVLVLDVALSEGMGCDAISIISGLDRGLPIIVTTEVNNPEQESMIRKKRIFYYHVKSFGMDELFLAISNAMMRSVH